MFAFEAGRNCWRVERATRAAIIVDGEDYFRALREALCAAQDVAVMVGWDFDFEIEMLPGQSDAEGLAPDGLPNRIGPFLEALVKRRESLDIYLLKWSGGALIAPGRLAPSVRIKLFAAQQVHLAFDGRHPIGACHHQKIVVIDDMLAFCGGIDVTEGRWDSRDHAPGNPRRVLRNGEPAQPWHDASAVFSGPAAAAMGELARARWKRANGEDLEKVTSSATKIWPESVEPMFRDVDLAIARTEPPEKDRAITNEIEQLYLDAIAAAEKTIYMESQYFASDVICDAIARRLAEPEGPEIVVINPEEAPSMVEDRAMHVTRGRMIRRLRAMDRHDRFRILYPLNADQEQIYVHAKIQIIDDYFLRVGSSNIDRRSMGFDTECDVAIVASGPQERAVVRAFRHGLLAEHLGRSREEVGQAAEQGGVIALIERLNDPARKCLRRIEPRKEDLLGRFLARTRFLDPRYRKSAQARLGLTSRHVFVALLVLAALLVWGLS